MKRTRSHLLLSEANLYMHDSHYLKSTDLLLSQNVMSNPKPHLSHTALPFSIISTHCVNHNCNLNEPDVVPRVILCTACACLPSRDVHLTRSREAPSSVPKPILHVYLCNILLIVHLGQLLIKI